MENIVYKITNSVNNKVYIGISTRGLKRRQHEHVYRFNKGERDHKLYLAMKKYGIDKFKFEVVCCALKKEYLPELEVAIIARHNSFDRGYNMTAGGDFVSDATKEKIRQKMLGRKITWYDKILKSRKKNKKDRTIKTYFVQFPDTSIRVVRNLHEFCRSQNIDVSNLYKTRTKPNYCKGYILYGTFNDQGESPYTQVGGNGEYPVALAG